jgi:hypothetical protein
LDYLRHVKLQTARHAELIRRIMASHRAVLLWAGGDRDEQADGFCFSWMGTVKLSGVARST